MPYSGNIVPVPIGTGGFNANQNISQLRPDELIQANNVTFQFGTIQKEGGSTHFTPSAITAAPVVVGGHDWFPTNSTTQRSVIVCDNKKILKDSGAGTYATTLKTLSNTPSNTPVFVEGGKEAGALDRKLFIYTGTNQVQVLSADGATTSDIAAPPSDWNATFPIGGCIHLNMHVGFGGQNPHWLYFSDPDDHEDFGGNKPQTNVTVTSGSKTITVGGSFPSTWKIGDALTDSGGLIPAGNTILTISGGTVTMSGGNATGSSAVDTVTANDKNVVAIPCYPGVGEGIRAITSFKRQLVVWKYPRGTFVVDTTNPDPTQWQTSRLSEEIGIASSNSWCPVDDDLLFMDATGSIHLLSTTLEYGDYGLRSVSDTKWIRNFIQTNIDQTKFPDVHAIFYLAKREAHFALTAVGSSTTHLRLVADFNRSEEIRFRPSDKDKISSLWLVRDSGGIPRPWAGDAAGFVWKLDQDAKDVNGAGFLSTWQTPHLDFSHVDPTMASKRKQFDFLELVIEPEGNWNLGIDIYVDGKYSQTQQFNMGVSGGLLGSLVLGVGALGSPAVLGARKRLTGSGKRISLVGNLGGADQDFSVSTSIYYFSVGSESNDH